MSCIILFTIKNGPISDQISLISACFLLRHAHQKQSTYRFLYFFKNKIFQDVLQNKTNFLVQKDQMQITNYKNKNTFLSILKRL